MSEGGGEVEPVSGAIVAASKVAKAADDSKLLQRLVGPLFDSMGLAWAAGYRQRNAEKIARKAARKVGFEQMALPRGVHTRVAHRILNDGSFVDEDVMQEYLAGLLAGARTAEARDDRASYYVDIVASLPASQVRLHHAVYSALATAGPDVGFSNKQVLDDHAVVVPLAAALDVVQPASDVELWDAAGEALIGLYREGLLRSFGVGMRPELKVEPGVIMPVMLAVPSQLGCFLALWAHAIRDGNIARLARILPCDFDTPGPSFGSFELCRWYGRSSERKGD